MKMKKWYLLSLLTLSLTLTNCVSVNVSKSETNNKRAQDTQIPVREYSIQSVIWQQNAAEYRALCYQAFNLAKLRLDYFLENLEATDKKPAIDRKSTRLNSSHVRISYAVFCLKKK